MYLFVERLCGKDKTCVYNSQFPVVNVWYSPFCNEYPSVQWPCVKWVSTSITDVCYAMKQQWFSISKRTELTCYV